MTRPVLSVLACLVLAGCISNTNTSAQLTRSGQLTSVGTPSQSAAASLRPQLTPNARMSAARLITANKTTTSGATLILASPAALAPDCSELGQVEARIVSGPEHGVVRIAKGTAFPNYAPGDPPYVCNARRSPATLITYRSEVGFVGEDTASVQIFFPDGRAPTLLVHITVH